MKHFYRVFIFFSIVVLLAGVTACQPQDAVNNEQNNSQKTTNKLILHHKLVINTDTKTGKLQVNNTLSLPDNTPPTLAIALNTAFTVSVDGKRLQATHSDEGISVYSIEVGKQRTLTLDYEGKLVSTPDCAWLQHTCVLLNEQGVYLDGNSYWYPQVANRDTRALHTFSLAVNVPEGWVSLSQGKKTTEGWQETLPQRSIYLLAGRFHVHESKGTNGSPDALVYLQNDDAELAQRYLDATHHYIKQYSQQLGAYPYAKFVTVESFWETGWGMPSFTLLGSRVIRFPFILNTSFPHEILHNWWGNGVYVDAQQGNWSEGLTAYLADHANKAAQGEGHHYRRDTLQKFATFAATGSDDFPLAHFNGRHNRATQAVGYGKSLMLFHMLKQKIGSEAFQQGLRILYQDYRHQHTSFDELRQVFETSSQQDLHAFFQQWLYGLGAPQLKVVSHSLTTQKGNKQLTFTLRQSQVNNYTKLQQVADRLDRFVLDIPLVVTHKDGRESQQTVSMTQSQQDFTVALDTSAAHVSIDPYFDTMRVPLADEVPAALNVLMSRTPKTFVIARQLPEGMELAWDDAIDTLSFGNNNTPVRYDDEALPESGTVVLLGGDNTMLSGLLARAGQPFKLTETAYTLNSQQYTCGLHSLALTLQAGTQTIILLDAPTPQALETLLRKVTHYGKYSYVLFNSVTGDNVAKGQWEAGDSANRLNVSNTSKHLKNH